MPRLSNLKKLLKGQPSSKDITFFFATNLAQGDLQGCLAGRTSRACVRETKSEVTLVLSGPSGPNRERFIKGWTKIAGFDVET